MTFMVLPRTPGSSLCHYFPTFFLPKKYFRAFSLDHSLFLNNVSKIITYFLARYHLICLLNEMINSVVKYIFFLLYQPHKFEYYVKLFNERMRLCVAVSKFWQEGVKCTSDDEMFLIIR